jgi:hypothetical protein
MLNKFVFNILNKYSWQIFFFIFFNAKKGASGIVPDTSACFTAAWNIKKSRLLKQSGHALLYGKAGHFTKTNGSVSTSPAVRTFR